MSSKWYKMAILERVHFFRGAFLTFKIAAATTKSLIGLFMVALCNRADHYIFMLWFVLLLLLLSFFFFLA